MISVTEDIALSANSYILVQSNHDQLSITASEISAYAVGSTVDVHGVWGISLLSQEGRIRINGTNTLVDTANGDFQLVAQELSAVGHGARLQSSMSTVHLSSMSLNMQALHSQMTMNALAIDVLHGNLALAAENGPIHLMGQAEIFAAGQNVIATAADEILVSGGTAVTVNGYGDAFLHATNFDIAFNATSISEVIAPQISLSSPIISVTAEQRLQTNAETIFFDGQSLLIHANGDSVLHTSGSLTASGSHAVLSSQDGGVSITALESTSISAATRLSMQSNLLANLFSVNKSVDIHSAGQLDVHTYTAQLSYSDTASILSQNGDLVVKSANSSVSIASPSVRLTAQQDSVEIQAVNDVCHYLSSSNKHCQ